MNMAPQFIFKYNFSVPKYKAKQLARKSFNCWGYLTYNEQMHPPATLLCNAFFSFTVNAFITLGFVYHYDD